MQEALETCAKLAVHTWRGLLAGGGILHADCEAMVYEDGSWQDDAPGAEWDPGSQQVTSGALINIRLRQNNPSMEILAEDTRDAVSRVVRNSPGEG
jgi:hypothetical protein